MKIAFIRGDVLFYERFFQTLEQKKYYRPNIPIQQLYSTD
ncbi:hypothetical protein CRYPA_1677 [uncultured Candidatus Thioglobus sp.]|nr:hypothetical protein CRYPA_1677 [uncultured Candidatus Thioglobus sp.]